MNSTPAVSKARRTARSLAAVTDVSFLLLRLFCPLPLAEAHSGTTAVFVDEFDAGEFEYSSNDIEGRARRKDKSINLRLPEQLLDAMRSRAQRKRAFSIRALLA